MDPGFLDKLSADGLYNLRAAIQARICQFHERSGNETPSQPNLSHGNRLPTRPDNMPSTIQDRGIERRFHHQRDLETITQVQGQPISSSFSQVPSGLNLENSVNQEIEPLGPGRAPFPAQSYVAKPPALVQPEQTWARGPAASLSVFKSDSLVPQNPQSPTLCSVGWPEVSRWQLRGEAQVADWNASQPYAAENDSTWQHGMRRPAVLGQQMQYHPVHLLGSSRSLREPDGSPSARNRTRPITSGAFVGGSISQLGILSQQLQPSAAYDHSLDGRLTDFGDSEPAPNGMNSMTSAALIGKNMRWPPPAVLRQYSEPYQIYDLSGNVWPMGFGSPVPISNGSALPRLERTKVPRVQSSRSCGTIRAKKRAHDEMANAGTNKNLQAKKKRGYPNNNQKDHANWVREIGACARCTKQHNKCRINLDDPEGTCLTCLDLSTTLDRQWLCFRGKITDTVLYRDYVDPDYGRPNFSESFDIGIGILKPFKGWDARGKEIELTRGLGPKIRLRVLKAKTLNQADIPEPQRSIYECPWALEDYPGAVDAFRHFLWQSISKEITNKVKLTEEPLAQVAFIIFWKAYKLATREDQPSILLQQILMVWSGSRLIEGEWYFHGSETLGGQTNSEGKVTLTAAPILDSEISSIIVKHHLRLAQTLASGAIQSLQDGSKSIRKKHMFELFLAYFILLHNCECIMKHQRKWAIHNNSPFLYTPKMMVLVKGILHTVETVLHLWRSDLKGQSPFSSDWQPNRTPKIAELTDEEYKFIKWVGRKAEGKEAHFNQLFQSTEHYDIDYCFAGQLFVRNWFPVPDMPERPPAPRYGPGY